MQIYWELFCFTMEKPIYISLFHQTLTVVDTLNRIYTFHRGSQKQLQETPPIQMEYEIKKSSTVALKSSKYVLALGHNQKMTILEQQNNKQTIIIHKIVDYVHSDSQIWVLSDQGNEVYALSKLILNSQAFTLEKIKQISVTINKVALFQNGVIVCDNILMNCYLNTSVELPLENSTVLDITSEYIAYSDEKSLTIFNLIKRNAKQIDLQSSTLIDGKFYNQNQPILVAACLHEIRMYNTSGTLIHKLQLNSKQYLKIHQFEQLYILDVTNLKILNLSSKSLQSKIQEAISCNDQELLAHQNIVNSLQHRANSLKILAKYLSDDDFQSVYRYLKQCENSSILNDGVLFVFHCQSARNSNIQLFAVLLSKLFQSKYESHIVNSLEMFLQIGKDILKATREQAQIRRKEFKQCHICLQNILESKKMKKIMEQSKKKSLFELGYELRHVYQSIHIEGQR